MLNGHVNSSCFDVHLVSMMFNSWWKPSVQNHVVLTSIWRNGLCKITLFWCPFDVQNVRIVSEIDVHIHVVLTSIWGPLTFRWCEMGRVLCLLLLLLKLLYSVIVDLIEPKNNVFPLEFGDWKVCLCVFFSTLSLQWYKNFVRSTRRLF